MGMDGHTRLSEALSSRPMAGLFKAGPGRGGSHKGEMRGLASEPQGKGRGTGTEAAVDKRQPLQHPHKQGRRAAEAAALLGPGLRQAHRHLPGQNSGPKHLPFPQQLWTGWSAWGLGRLQLSDSSGSWGGKESRSAGTGSPRWCLRGPPGPSAGPW